MCVQLLTTLGDALLEGGVKIGERRCILAQLGFGADAFDMRPRPFGDFADER